MSGTYSDGYIAPQTGIGAGNHAGEQGATANVSAFYNHSIWGPGMLNFDESIWNFGTVVGKGYPTLRGLDWQ